MKITTTGRKVSLKPVFIERADKRMAKLDKFFSEEAIAQVTVKKDGDSWAVEGYDLIPCRLSSTDSKNDYRPRPYDKDEDGYARTISKLDGSWTGSDLNVDYSFMYQ